MSILVWIFYYLLSYCHSFIIPNELPTILSVIYSNIPPIKLGIDTRIGYGFRLGPHADYQSLVEIGPQTNTNPISTNGTVAKRQSVTLNRLQRLYKEALKKAEKKTDSVSQKKEISEKKAQKTLSGQIEFNKVPGIDEEVLNPKIEKRMKSTTESAPTKFTLYTSKKNHRHQKMIKRMLPIIKTAEKY